MERQLSTDADWLDACWRCGSEDVIANDDGRVLCGPCRGHLFGTQEPGSADVQVPQRVYWESHALERCWLCMTHQVDPQDDLGLCAACR